MPLIKNFPLPASASELPPPEPTSTDPFFLVFVTSPDPTTGQSWCPDVRAAWPVLEKTFVDAEAPRLGVVEVGQKDEWKNPTNIYRTTWKVPCIPLLIRYELVDGAMVETGRLAEGEILDEGKLGALVGRV
ncbi:uncharacterized protein BP01DRAFT_390154 [Aspergillus saccharolyticus JOP 1030-1]|uniref:Thioredoxin domain-containing protein n=1 Tax=Aspergillus saccharolyticus JOP 1030-1 TaxID=1450539 RepID=A0A318ZL87_9EURO|nr:hypothetical protein BP01DRAFT_390154 [Aspergillus saccharolyticus JOP 1030-1]PYH47637.1 hypothetical protein BP01DRAFT_390154 [Aspergillus saccharolyticus JOP 1030-1]